LDAYATCAQRHNILLLFPDGLTMLNYPLLVIEFTLLSINGKEVIQRGLPLLKMTELKQMV